MLINLRNALMTGKRLPYDAEVEYLRVDAVGPYIVIDGVTYCNAVGTYYAFTISSGGVVTHDLIPVRLGNTGYMYDRITNKRFGNAGTGDFVLGPDVVPATWVDGEYWNTFGVATALSGASRCDNFIPVQPSSSVTFYLGARPGGTTLYMVQYDANKERVNSTYNGNGSARTVTIPANCYYIRVSVETAKKNEAYIHDNTNDKDLLRNGVVVVS